MKYLQIIIFIFIIINLFSLSSEIEHLGEFNFGGKKDIIIEGSEIYQITANYNTDNKYLHIYPTYYEYDIVNAGMFKFYVKEYSNTDLNTPANYLKSDFSTVEVNSGLYIAVESLHYKDNKASIFVVTYGKCILNIHLVYSETPNFPVYTLINNFQINQFTLPKGKEIEMTFQMKCERNDTLTILSKTSLRNVDIQIIYDKKDITKDRLACIYPNGCSLFLNKNFFDPDISIFIKVIITNKNNKDEIIVLGYNHYNKNKIFFSPIKNGYQLYLDGNSSYIYYLQNSGENLLYNQYYTYQASSKLLKLQFVHADEGNQLAHYVKEYSNMAHLKVDSKGKLEFDFTDTPLRTGIYIQYIDYNEPEIAQKVLQPLVSGVPKSMLIPEGKSMFHYLPINKQSTTINYYLRYKNSQDIKVYFTKCTNYPEKCPNLEEEQTRNYPIIDNIGLWYSVPVNNSELKIIYINCEKEECSYDILMTYDNDPLFLFPGTNYTKFINDKGEDTFILPVYEYFNITLIKTDFINIDLNVLSGKADLILKNRQTDAEIKNYELHKIGNKKTYTIYKDSFLSDGYFKNEIKVIVKQAKNYKNTMYNLMYGTGEKNIKSLANNIINKELLKVADSSEIQNNTKHYNFVNYKDENLYIIISSQICQMKITVNDSKSETGYSYSSKFGKGNHKFSIYLMNDEGGICNKGFEEEVTLFAYHDNTNIVLSENSIIKSNFTTNTISFKHLFKFNNDENDKSFNIEIEKLLGDSLNYNYKLERISFNSSEENTFMSAVQPVISKQVSFISSSQINAYCDNLLDNETCSLTITFTSNSKGATFGLYLDKNGHNYVRHLGNETLINSINPGNIRYYYIDLNKNYDIEILLNSYGQDLDYSCSSIITKQTDEEKILDTLTTFSSGSNYHIISKKKDKNCDTFCRLYIGIHASGEKSLKEAPTTFSINYIYKDSGEIKSEIDLPLNYFVQYKFDDLNEIKYSINILKKSSVVLELYSIKENEADNSEVTATFSQQGGTEEDLLPKEKMIKDLDVGNYEIIIKNPNEKNKPLYKFRLSSLEQETPKSIIPILSTYSEKCSLDSEITECYYKLDIPIDAKDNRAKYAYFYVPETEEAIISIKGLDYTSDLSNLNSIKEYDKISNSDIKRSNWYEYKIENNTQALLIKLSLIEPSKMDLTLYSSFTMKPKIVTLNYGEKRIFTIEKSKEINTMNLYFNKNDDNKYRINLHAVRGNGVFKTKGEIYPLGLEASYKENISIIVDSNTENLDLVATNNKDGTPDQFVFTVDYTLTTTNQLFYEIYQNRKNSFKFLKDSNLYKITFYMKANKTEPKGTQYKDVEMNIKIFSNETKFTLKTFIVDEDFIQNIKKNIVNEEEPSSIVRTVKNYINGGSTKNGELTFLKLKINSKDIEGYDNGKNLYIYLVFSQSEVKIKKVRFDLYPYEIPYSLPYNLPLASNELFVETIKAKSTYTLLLAKNENITENMKNIRIDFVRPLFNNYDISFGHDLNDNKKPRMANETNLVLSNSDPDLDETDNPYYGKQQILLNSKLKQLYYILFNIETGSKDDTYIFKYGSDRYDLVDQLSLNELNFEVKGTIEDILYKIDIIKTKNNNGKVVIIINAYNEDDIKKLKIENPDLNYLSLNLLFSDLKPVDTSYREYYKDNSKPIQREIKSFGIKDSGNYYFSCVGVVIDNEREEYFGYKAIKFYVEDSGFFGALLNYMKNHVLATILIIIIILLFIGIIINLFRAERRTKIIVDTKKVQEMEGELIK